MKGCTLDIVKLPDDIDFLYAAMVSDDQYLYSTKLNFNSTQSFERWLTHRLYNEFNDFFIIRDPLSSKPFGYVYNYDFSLTDGHCKLVVYVCPEYRETGIGGIAAITFMKKLFDTYPLRKLYSTIYDYNKESLRSNFAAGFIEEGLLNNYRYFDGNYHSIHYLSISRKTFEDTIGRFLNSV